MNPGSNRRLPHRERLIPLSAPNFRDLGGYQTQDGRSVKWGLVYRSGRLSGLTGADSLRFDHMGIKVVCDLRATSERRLDPFDYSGNREVLYRSTDYENDHAALRGLISVSPTARAMREGILARYSELPWRYAFLYRELFARLAAGDMPLVFACSAGKDRTGLGAALLLAALQVPQTTILEDYNLTDRLVDLEARLVGPMLADGASAAAGFEMLGELSQAARAPLLAADPAYLTAAMDAIAVRHGCVDGFLREELGIGPNALASIRESLLEEVTA